MEVNGKLCILHARTQAAFASILIPGLPEPYRKSEPKECCVLFFMTQAGMPKPETKKAPLDIREYGYL